MAPTGILDFPQKEAGAHPRVIAGPVVIVAVYLELVAEIVQLVARKVIDVAGGTQGAIVCSPRLGQPVILERATDATHIKSGIVCHQHRRSLKAPRYVLPYLRKGRRAGGIFWTDTMNKGVEIAVLIEWWLDEPRTGVHDEAIVNLTDAGLTNGGARTRGSLEVYGDEIQPLYHNLCT